MSKKVVNWISLVLILLTLLLLVSAFSLSLGSADISAKKIISSLSTKSDSIERTILVDIRIPRIILAIAVGGALALAGVLLQGMFHNPLVEPYTLGISGGAALGVCINIVSKLYRISPLSLPLSGFLGAVIVVMLTYFLASRGGFLKIQGLLLIGVMISFITSSLVMLIMSISQTQDLHGIVFWVMGSLSETDMGLIKLMGIVSLSGLFVSYLFCSDLNALSLGEEDAMHLGVNVERTKRFLFLLASILTGFAVSMTGVIGFVGLVIPHFVRRFIGSDHKIVLISSYIVGAIFLILCDTLARTIISPLELPVGVITGILGGTVFIWALSKKDA